MRTTPFTCLLLTAAAFSLGCDSTPIQPSDAPDRPSAAVVFNEQTHNVTGPVTNDCTGDILDGIGAVHELVAFTDDGAGGFHEKLHLNVQFTATSQTTGARYVSHQTFNLAFNAKAGEEQTVQLTFTLIGQGSAPNEVSTFIGHFRVLADGTITSEFDNFRLRCQ